MITKVREMRQSMLYSSNFEHNPNTTTGLNFGYFAGAAHKDDVVTELAASTVTVPNGTSVVYIDMEPTPIIKNDVAASITSTRFVPLYNVTAASGTISLVTDLRSFTSAGQSVNQT